MPSKKTNKEPLRCCAVTISTKGKYRESRCRKEATREDPLCPKHAHLLDPKSHKSPNLKIVLQIEARETVSYKQKRLVKPEDLFEFERLAASGRFGDWSQLNEIVAEHLDRNDVSDGEVDEVNWYLSLGRRAAVRVPPIVFDDKYEE